MGMRDLYPGKKPSLQTHGSEPSPRRAAGRKKCGRHRTEPAGSVMAGVGPR